MEKVIDVIMGGFDDGRMPGVQQYDAGSRVFVCRLWEKPDVAYVMAENAMASTVFDWRGAPPSNEYKQQIVDRSTVRVVVPAEAMKRSGPVDMQLTIRQNGTEERSPILCFPVWKSLLAGEQNYPEPVRVLDDLINRTNETADRVEQLKIDASGLAGDALKLGGKPPEYYLPAVNLLDNSRFEIAQAGYNGMHGSTRYCADAWPTLFGAAVTLVKNDGYITLETTANYRYMHQTKLVSELTENAYTFSVKKRGNKTTTMRLICAKGTETAQIKTAWISAGSEWNTGILTFTRDEIAAYDKVWFAITNEEAGSVDYKEPVLYPGTYTADTLPPFVPRPYAAELAECQRYYENSWFGAAKTDLFQMIGSCWNGSHFDVPVEFKQQKRTKPSMNYYPSGSRTTVQGYVKSAYRDVTILDPEYRMGLRGVYARVRVAEADLTIGYTYQLHAHWEANADL